MTIYRFHEHPHFTTPDIIISGLVEAMQLEAEVEYVTYTELLYRYADE